MKKLAVLTALPVAFVTVGAVAKMQPLFDKPGCSYRTFKIATTAKPDQTKLKYYGSIEKDQKSREHDNYGDYYEARSVFADSDFRLVVVRQEKDLTIELTRWVKGATGLQETRVAKFEASQKRLSKGPVTATFFVFNDSKHHKLEVECAGTQ